MENGGSTTQDVSLDAGRLVDFGQPHSVPTPYGVITVLVSGDRRKSALLTCHDVGLDPQSCFQGLLMCAGAESPLVSNFCHYHLVLPGFEEGAQDVPSQLLPITVHKLTDMVAAVVEHFGVKEVVGMGVGYGAHVLINYALKHKQVMSALILVSPLCKKAGWTEWLNLKAAVGQLWYAGMSGWVTEYLISRLVHKDMMHKTSDLAQAFRRELARRPARVIKAYLLAVQTRVDLLHHMDHLSARIMLFVGTRSPFANEGMEMNTETSAHSSYMEVLGCGTVVTEESPGEMMGPLHLFLQRLAQLGIGL